MDVEFFLETLTNKVKNGEFTSKLHWLNFPCIFETIQWICYGAAPRAHFNNQFFYLTQSQKGNLMSICDLTPPRLCVCASSSQGCCVSLCHFMVHKGAHNLVSQQTATQQSMQELQGRYLGQAEVCLVLWSTSWTSPYKDVSECLAT